MLLQLFKFTFIFTILLSLLTFDITYCTFVSINDGNTKYVKKMMNLLYKTRALFYFSA